MTVVVRGKNMEVTSALKEFVERKLVKLEKYLPIPEAYVTLKVEKATHKVEVTLPINGMILRGEETTDDMYASIDLVIDKLEKQIIKYKGRFERKNQAYNEGKQAQAPAIADEETFITRIKKFAVKPMDIEEAVLQMNLLGHSFYVFANAETEKVNVLYVRKDGNYGLIEPEI